ncbi:MAG: peptidylprolyl isomerase [Gemmatimonadaceae bacterium]
MMVAQGGVQGQVQATRGGAAVALSASDSALVGRLLLAEERRDITDVALAQAAAHPDARMRLLARRAAARITDPRFATRDSFPPLPAPKMWAEPAWRLRLRALTAARADCAALRLALRDEVSHVRLRAIDLAGSPPSGDAPLPCAADDSIATALVAAIDALPADASTRAAGATSWHTGAHAIVALARIRPAEARERLPRLAAHAQWQVRQYAARAAGALGDSALLREMARDAHDNVKETAIEQLSRRVGHAADDVYLAALGARGAQAVRAAAIALKGSSRAEVPAAALATLARFTVRANASERDARVALLEAAGRAASEDSIVRSRLPLPADAVALALGADIRLRVTISPRNGGGEFTVRLRGDVAPMMAARILELVRQGYYHGLDWHRVEPDFVVQGLSPGANEYVGYAYFLADELGTVPHARGTLGMSTRGHDTGDAQWFINLRDNLRLGRDYTVWAEIVEGIEVADAVLEGDVVERIQVLR